MHKSLFYKFGFMLLVACFTITSCNSDGDDTIVLENGININEGRDQTQVVSTSESANFTRNGFTLTIPRGAVPRTNSGSNGRVAFSIVSVSTSELPTPLPAGANILNNASIKVEPMNFTFTSPLVMRVPTRGYTLSRLALLHYNEYTGSWEVIPFSSINSDGTANVSIIELGYFVLVQYSTTRDTGGLRISKSDLDENYYYYMTVIPRNGNSSSVKRISFAPRGEDLYMANVDLGSYNVVIARERRTSWQNEATETQYYSNISVNVSTPLVETGSSFATYTGWTDIRLTSGSWNTGRPSAWGTVTATYGTGKFQATLTWVNTPSSGTDYDLHLFGPNNIHVFFDNEKSGAFELDRDWLTESGNAIENIYNISDDITPGTYVVRVHHYSGVLGKQYNCRVIIDGVVVKSISGRISTNNHYDDIYSFQIQ